MPENNSTLNNATRKKEGKCRRKDGKSQNRRGGPKSKSMPAVTATPSKTPPTVTTPSTPPPPLVIAPITAPVPITATLVKDPTAASPNQTKEGKVNRRKIKDKAEKDPPKTTIRKKKNSGTMSISVDLRSSAENDGRAEKKKSQTSSEDSAKKRKSMESKSGGSKEPSDNDDKTPQKFNKEAAQDFFRHMMQSKRAQKRTDDARMETMPESSQMNRSARSIKRKLKKTPKEPLENIFKLNGEPVWIVQELPEDEWEKNEDGVAISNPELAAAMAEDHVELDERNCFDRIGDYISCTMSTGKLLPSDCQPDYAAPFEKLEANNKYFSADTVTYNTVRNMVELSDAAIKRFEAKRDGMVSKTSTETLTTSLSIPAKIPSTELFQLKTCIVSNVTINLKSVVSVTYDRHHPIASIQKLRKKLNNTRTMEHTVQDSKEKTCNS